MGQGGGISGGAGGEVGGAGGEIGGAGGETGGAGGEIGGAGGEVGGAGGEAGGAGGEVGGAGGEPACTPVIETCDGADNDCDGIIDNVAGVGDACTEGVGACEVTGTLICGEGGLVCDVATVEPTAEICDGVDNDCDGVIDNGFDVGAACAAGVGACEAAGVLVCAEDGASAICDAVAGEPAEELCDGIDNNCDGEVDNVEGLGEACTEGVGACAAEGAWICGEGALVCDAVAGEPTDELCDGVDNNCDGVADEGGTCAQLLGGVILVCGDPIRDLAELFTPEDGVAVQSGCEPDADVRSMAISRQGVIANPALVRGWVGDGGQIITEFSGSDEVFNVIFEADVAQAGGRSGRCQDNVNPVVRFNEDNPFWQANGDLPLQDEDSSGCGFDVSAFPGITPLGGWDADTVSLAYRELGAGRVWLVESDWQDGEASETHFNAATQQIMRYMLLGSSWSPSRDVLLRCGNSQRDVSTFIPEGADLRVEEGCTPNAAVKTMLITRSGAGNVDAAGLRDLLNGGGNVITEYSISHLVYNAVFPEVQVAQGMRYGQCGDNVNTPVRFNEDDAFWQDNGELPLEEGQTGCGYDVSAFPGITPLGGWDADTVSLAYKDVGLGRLWLVESDWQDSQELSDASLQLMQYMVTSARDDVPQGVQQNVSAQALADAGWTECYSSLFNTGGDSLDVIQDDCAGDAVMMACRPVGEDAYTLAAAGAYDDVFFDVGAAFDASHQHNGVTWYYSPSRSWGFAPGGVAVTRSSCDTQNAQGEQRMCIHTGGGLVNPGYRCGQNNLNDNAEWERVILKKGQPPLRRLGAEQAFGHHGDCNSFNGCVDGQGCADLACMNAGYTSAISFEEGLCTTLSNGAVPNIVCNMFRNADPQDLQEGWGPSGACNVPVAYDVLCQ